MPGNFCSLRNRFQKKTPQDRLIGLAEIQLVISQPVLLDLQNFQPAITHLRLGPSLHRTDTRTGALMLVVQMGVLLGIPG